MFALAPDAQLLVLQFAGAPTGAELMATSRAARPPPAAMYALHRVWMPRWEATVAASVAARVGRLHASYGLELDQAEFRADIQLGYLREADERHRATTESHLRESRADRDLLQVTRLRVADLELQIVALVRGRAAA